MSEVEAFVRDLALRAAHTFWQAFVAGLAVLWAASGLDVADLVRIDAWHKVLAMLIAAAGAALLSTLKNLAANAGLRKRATQIAADVVEDTVGVDVDQVLADADAIHPMPTPTPKPQEG